MSDDATTVTPGRGTPESAAWFRGKLEQLGLSQSALARRMVEAGDDREPATVLRTIQRMASGQARVSGEMRAMLSMMQQLADPTVSTDR